MAEELDEVVDQFRDRPLHREYPYLWLDALVIKSREAGRTVNVAVVPATGVNEDGYREILGLDVITGEDRAGWSAFVRGLVSRGLKGVRLATSDAHPGLRDAVASALPGAGWQRCRTHFMCNLPARVPKAAQNLVATLVRSIFAQPDRDSVGNQLRYVVDQLRPRYPDAARLLEDAREELLAFASFPKAHWRQIRSNNPLERLNKEIRRRSNVVGFFPNRAAVVRLIGAVLAEQNDEWAIAKRYMSLHSLALLKPPELPETIETEETEVKLIPDRQGLTQSSSYTT